MHSPVRRPRWNGTCEVSGRWAKRDALAAMVRRGSVTLSQCDLDAAVGVVAPLTPHELTSLKPQVAARSSRAERRRARQHAAQTESTSGS